MKRTRDLVVTNILALLVVLAAFLAGWRDAALFGLAVLAVMDLIAVVREQWPHALFHRGNDSPDLVAGDETDPPAATDPGPVGPEAERTEPDREQ